MKNFFIYAFFFVSLISTLAWSDDVFSDDLDYRNETYYKRFTCIPIAGKVNGRYYDKIKKGNRFCIHQQFYVDCSDYRVT